MRLEKEFEHYYVCFSMPFDRISLQILSTVCVWFASYLPETERTQQILVRECYFDFASLSSELFYCEVVIVNRFYQRFQKTFTIN